MCCWTGPYMGGRSRGRTRPPAGHKGGNSLANKHTAPTDVPPPNGPGLRPDAPTTWAPGPPPPLQDSVDECKQYWNGTMSGKNQRSTEKEQKHDDVSTRNRTHSRRNETHSASGLPQGNPGDAPARCVGSVV